MAVYNRISWAKDSGIARRRHTLGKKVRNSRGTEGLLHPHPEAGHTDSRWAPQLQGFGGNVSEKRFQWTR